MLNYPIKVSLVIIFELFDIDNLQNQEEKITSIVVSLDFDSYRSDNRLKSFKINCLFRILYRTKFKQLFFDVFLL